MCDCHAVHCTWIVLKTNRRPGPAEDETSRQEDNFYLMLDPQLHPVPPDMSCQQSVEIFNQHKELAQEYLKVQTEIAYLTRYMDQLAGQLSEAESFNQMDVQNNEHHQENLKSLEDEKENLVALRRNLIKQLELMNRQQRSRSGDEEGWVLVPRQQSTPLN